MKSKSSKQRHKVSQNTVSSGTLHQSSMTYWPQSSMQFKAGIDLVLKSISPTLGPVPHMVAIDQMYANTKPPEIFDDGATIARRIIQIRHRGQNMGAMFLRHMLWELHESTGDGTTTAALLFQSLFNQGVRYVQDGVNPMLLRDHLEKLTNELVLHIKTQSIYLFGKDKLTALAKSISYDSELSNTLGEIFDVIGEYGHLEVRSGPGHGIERSYMEGMYWESGVLCGAMIEDKTNRRTSYENAAILVTDLDIKDALELVPVLNTAIHAGITHLVIVAKTITDRALSILLMTENRNKINTVVVKIPGNKIYTQRHSLEDLAMLTGAKILESISGDSLQQITLGHFGFALRAWANFEFFGIVGGKGDIRILRSHISDLRRSFTTASGVENRTRLQARIGKLMGGAATLYIGDYAPVGQSVRKKLAERTAVAMRGAIVDGVVPGGGVTLLGCRNLLRRKLIGVRSREERVACIMLLATLEVPARTLLQNAGLEPTEWLIRLKKAGVGMGCDTINRRVVSMHKEGIYDPTVVVTNALYFAVYSAALALTVDVLVHRKLLPLSISTG